MIKALLTLDDIIQMTREAGEEWAVAHAKRLLALIQQIGADVPHDPRILELAVYLHDWGAFPLYIQKGVEHAIRSRQVVEREILPCLDLTGEQKVVLLEAIELHDYRDSRPPQSSEALLLREADMLEFLGMIGMAREFARGPKNLETSYKGILSRRYGIEGRFTLPRAREIARIRLERMEKSLQWLNEESFGIL
jgi:HD superfamily phosphodiesterase